MSSSLKIAIFAFQKNDKEKELMKLSVAHEGQQELLQRLQSKNLKLKKMEEACKKQEQVIEKMEELLSNKPQQNKGQRTGC